MSALTNKKTVYDGDLEVALAELEPLLKGDYLVSRRSVALLLLQEDPDIIDEVAQKDGESLPAIRSVIERTKNTFNQPLSYIIAMNRQAKTDRILHDSISSTPKKKNSYVRFLDRAMMNPVSGLLILILVLYVGLYLFVGVFGAGTLVDLIENTIFGKWLNPFFTDIVTSIIPSKMWQDLFIGDFGLITLGLNYAIAIVFPIVGTFFIAFSIIEDSGYLPRLAMLIDRLFKKIGLSGRAVIPIVLGLGCDTMATIVTRTQETKRERIITTLLLALAIPCSAQLGVIFGILSFSTAALLIWVGVVIGVLLLVGWLASKILPGERASFYMEIPPLRLPKLSNVLAKTVSRLQWYLAEVIPLFLIASVLLWIGQITGFFDILIGWIEPLVQVIGLPRESAVAFLYGFFRRDFGAAGLYDLTTAGALTGVPLVVSAVTMTLFIPCIAQFMVMLKERGIRTTLAITLFVFPFAFFVGWLLNLILTSLGVTF